MSSWRRVAAFSGIGVGLHLLCCLLFAIVVRRHDARKMDERWLAGPRAVDLMIAGDSHARYAVEGPVLGAAINVAVPGEHYQKSVYRVPWLLDHGTREVDAVILPFDAISFADFKADSFGPELVWGRYIDWMDLGRMRGQPYAFAVKGLKARLAPYFGEGEALLQWATRSRHFRGQMEKGLIGVAAFEGGAAVARRHLGSAASWDPAMEVAFRRLVADLVARRIRVILVSFPVTWEYHRELEDLGADPADRERLFAELGRPGVVDRLDYEPLFFGEPGNFGDGDHLSLEGKRQFSKVLRADLHALGVLRRGP